MTNRSTQTKQRLGLSAIAVVCCVLVFLAMALPHILHNSTWVAERFNVERIPFLWSFPRAEASAEDALLVYGKKAVLAPDVVFLAIDSPSFEQSELSPQERLDPALQMMAEGFPFPRAVYPLIVERLMQAGAKVVIFDLLFPVEKEGDEAFRPVLDKYADSVVIGSNLQTIETVNEGARNLNVPPSASLIDAKDRTTDRRVGFVNFRNDDDGIVRRAQYRTTLLEFFNERPPNEDLESPELLSLMAQGATKAGFASMIPPGRLPMRFRFLKDPRYLSLHDIFVPALWGSNLRNGEVFRNKIVFIGPYGNWSKDELLTPFGSRLGPEVHLGALNSLLTQDYLRNSRYWTDVWLIVLAGVVAVAAGWQIGHPVLRTGALLVLLGVYIGLVFLLFNFDGLILNVLAPPLALLSSGFIGLVWERVIEGQEKARVRQTLERYVSKDVVAEVLDNPESFLNTEVGLRKSITVLFADIRGFTTLTESADPVRLVKQLNEYFTEMVRIVFANRGTLDKFIGDAVMAHWGSIVTRGPAADACRAVASALQMHATLPKLNARWKEQGLAELKVGFGVNHGDAICGHIGSDEKHEVTAIGDAVNLASRLESATKEFRQDILLGEQIEPLIKDQFILRSVELLQVKGKTRPVKVFSVLGDRHEMKEPEWLAWHEEGMRHYRERKFQEAYDLFEKVTEALPGDWLSAEYQERCREFVEEGPPENWDGSYVMTRK